MNLTVLGSGSRGNAVALGADGGILLLDAGFGPRALRRRAQRAGLDLDQVVGVILTHEHWDHARGGVALAGAVGCPLYASAGTLRGLAASGRPLSQLDAVAVGPFTVTACRTTHDAAEPLAVAVTGPDGEKVGVALDLGEAGTVVRYLLRASDCLVVEANHDEVMLRTGPYPATVRHRIAGRGGHLSNGGAADLLADLWHPGLQTVILAHLSEQCNRPALAVARARRALEPRGFSGAVLVAEQDAALGPIEVRPAVPALEVD